VLTTTWTQAAVVAMSSNWIPRKDQSGSLKCQTSEETSHKASSSSSQQKPREETRDIRKAPKKSVEEETQSHQTQKQGQATFDMSGPLTLDEVRIAAGQGDERAAKALADLGRLSEAKQKLAAVAMLHRLATARGRGQYTDPNTGFYVFTATFLKQRDCCGLGCRHCPHLGISPNAACTDKKSKESAAALANDW